MHDSIKTGLVALLIALLPCAAGAAGMGRLNVLSALGQPLVAEIDLSVSKEELSSLSVRLGSPDAYRAANLQYNPALTGARVAIERRPGGQSFLKITSNRPVAEPFIDLLVELTWAAGRLSREYTALLDPPGVPSAPPAPSIAAIPEARPVPAPASEAAPQPKTRASAPSVSRPVTAGPLAGGKEYGPIQRGETLGKIAREVMPEGVTLEQMLVALYRSNPDAFIRKNLNLVRAGKVLRVPDRDEVAAVSRGEATKEYRTHVADWNTYRQKVAEAAGAAPESGRTAVSGRISTKVEDKGGTGEPKDVVRLSKGEPAGAGKAKPRSSAERIRMLEEEAVAREKTLTEANSRITQLEKTIQDMKKLAELKSPGMAAAQQQAAATKPEAKKAEAAPAKPAEAPKPEAKKPEAVAAVKPEPEKPAEAPKPVEAAKPVEAPKPAPKADAKPAPKKPAPPAKKEPELTDQIMDALTDPLYLAAGGGVIVLGGLAFWMSRRRRSRGADDMEPVAPTLSKAAAAAAGAAAMTEDDSAAQPSGAADEVDPLAEAEVYIAYGRDGQAEEILKEALAKNPQREDVQLKLLEIYSARKDKDAFGKIAASLNKQTGGSGDAWLKAAAMGYLLDSANPLYAAGKDAAAMAPATGGATDVDLDLGVGEAGTQTDITLDAGAATAGTDTGILDLGVGDKVEEAAATPDFSLDVPAAEPQPDTVAAAVAPQPESNVIDFQIELPKAGDDATTKAAAAPAAATVGDNSGLDFKLDDLNLSLDATTKLDAPAAGGEKDGHWYDVQTKFDLAKAYQEMGDKDGAKEILQEVIKEGDDEQKTQAKALLDSLA